MNITELLQYDFFTNTILAAAFASIAAGIIGTYIVSRRMVFLSGGITHASFGGIGIAYYFGFNPVLGAAAFAVLSALGIDMFAQRRFMRHDSLIGLWWSAGMALGIVFIYLTPGYTPNLMTYLFGSILTVSGLDVWLLAGLALVVAVYFIFFHKAIMYIAFDPEYARTHNVPVHALSLFTSALVALTIVFSIKVAGIILVISLLTVPQAIVNMFTHNYKNIMLFSVVLSFVGIFAGLVVSFSVDIPSGATIIFSLLFLFLMARLIVWIMHRAGLKRSVQPVEQNLNQS
ncbi:metal ABC transporter permease [Salinivirga cyanobacteriivorans]|uniref:Manganese transport system membrane protein MntB n=1 Tax=Salinivirga cyanobacteriivorans TaxID=1307839 RepID=A0A0S2HWR9_9BACT|nr:metal ABC transporter permease [Salinivirga cyanobacteriivorans]ALO14477.1 Manganese transport system membrane protein MntB [Salinivirga cyanobacteriivorans]